MTASVTAGRYNPDDPALDEIETPEGEPVSRRHQALGVATAAIRLRRGLVMSVEHILLIAGSILLPLGVVFILLGWDGAAHTPKTYEQIDYLISGGLLGVGLLVAGGFMYFGYWLSRQLKESRRQNALSLQAIARLEQALQGSLNGQVRNLAVATGTVGAAVGAGPAGDGPPTRRRRGAATNGRAVASDDPTGEVAVPQLVVTPRGTLMHRPDCPVVANRQGLRAVAAGTKGYQYCTMCDAASVRA